MKMILIASTVLFASVLVNAGEIKRIEGPFSQAGRVEFEFEPITSLKGHCLEGSGQGAMKTGVASIPEYAFAKFNCTVQLVSDADLKKFILDPRQTVVSLTSTASGQKISPVLAIRPSTPTSDEGFTQAFIRYSYGQREFPISNPPGVSIELEVYCVEPTNKPNHCTESVFEPLVRYASDYYGQRLNFGLLPALNEERPGDDNCAVGCRPAPNFVPKLL